MWDDKKQIRFDELRRNEFSQPLSPAEQRELAELIAELDREEEQLLAPAIERALQEQTQLRQAIAQAAERSASLVTVVERRTQLRERAQAQLTELLREHQALQEEYQRALTS
jgi:hypothetical protein